MAKSISADKRENEKKRLARRAEKQKKKEEKKLSNKANSFEDMIAYVDENGMITSTPPAENTPKEEIKLEEIVKDINKPKSYALKDKLYRNAITLIKDDFKPLKRKSSMTRFTRGGNSNAPNR